MQVGLLYNVSLFQTVSEITLEKVRFENKRKKWKRSKTFFLHFHFHRKFWGKCGWKNIISFCINLIHFYNFKNYAGQKKRKRGLEKYAFKNTCVFVVLKKVYLCADHIMKEIHKVLSRHNPQISHDTHLSEKAIPEWKRIRNEWWQNLETKGKSYANSVHIFSFF